MSEDCKTESEIGSVSQAWDWEEGKRPSGDQDWSSTKQPAQEFQASAWAGDALWRNPTRTCAPELFTVVRLGTIKLGSWTSKHIKTSWEDQVCGIYDAPGLRLALPLGDSGKTIDLIEYLNSIKGQVSEGKFQESVTLWSLFWIYLNAQAKVIDSIAVWLYTNSKDSGKFSESLVFDSSRFIQSQAGLQERVPLVSLPWFVEWLQLWERISLAAAPGFVDSGTFQETRRFNSARYKSESGKIWEYVIFFGGYGVGSGYGLGEYGK